MVDSGEHFKAGDPNRPWTEGGYGTFENPESQPGNKRHEADGQAVITAAGGVESEDYGVDPAKLHEELAAIGIGSTETQPGATNLQRPPESAADWVARQGRIDAADRANRDQAGLPPRPLDLR